MRDEEKKRTSQNTNFQAFFRKRWVFPAIYLISAAVILTAVLWYQSIGNDVTDDFAPDTEQGTALTDEPTAEVNVAIENVNLPALDPESVKVVKKFYDPTASEEEQAAALVFYNNTYSPNKGIDLARADQKEFDVVASLSGTVTKAEKDPILGYVIEIDHKDNLVTVYQSLQEVTVAAGDKVEQSELIGKAGKNLFNEKDGIHVHFEIRKDGQAVNPTAYLDKPVTSIAEEAEKEDSGAGEATEDEATKEDESKTENESKTDDEKDKKDAGEEKSEGTEDLNQPEASKGTLNS